MLGSYIVPPENMVYAYKSRVGEQKGGILNAGLKMKARFALSL